MSYRSVVEILRRLLTRLELQPEEVEALEQAIKHFESHIKR